MKRVLFLSLYILCVLSVLTAGTWDGLYRWDNPTKKDNKGKMKSLVMRVITNDEGNKEIFFVEDGGEYRIFPLLAEDDPGYTEWHKYKEDSPAAACYRANNEKFNTSSISPSKWMIGEVVVEEDYLMAVIVSKAMGIEVEVVSTYRFGVDEHGAKTLTFASSSDSKLAKGAFYSNPDPASDGSFTLTIVSEEGTV